MSYIGKQPGFGIRNRYYYTATATQTLFSGADDNGQTLAYADSKYLDVFLNGVSLVAGTDYTATTLTSVSLTSGAAADDIVEIVAYDIFSVADTVSAANGGTFSGAITVDADGATVATFDRATSDGAIVEFQKDGSTVGQINTVGGNSIASGSNDVGVKFQHVSPYKSVIPFNPSTNGNSDNNIDLGIDNARFKDLYLSGGVYLGGTGSANKLDDYETGTFTPTMNSGSCSGTCKYIKIGALVFVQSVGPLTHATDGSTATGVSVTNLPFVVSEQTLGPAYGSPSLFDSGSSSAPFMQVDDGTTNAVLHDFPSGSGANDSRWQSGTSFFFAVTYYTTA